MKAKLKLSHVLKALLLIVVSVYFYKQINNWNLKNERCLFDSYENSIGNFENLEVNHKYDFSKIFACKEWSEVLIIGEYTYRSVVFFKTSILLPNFDFSNVKKGSSLLYFIKNKNVISEPIIISHESLILSNNYNKSLFLKVNKNRANFVFKKLEDSDLDIFTLELVKPDRSDLQTR